MEIVFEWDDAFDIDVHRRSRPRGAARMGAEAMAKIPRMRQAEPSRVPTALSLRRARCGRWSDA